MTTRNVYTGNSIYGGRYAEDSEGNIGRGPTDEAALTALRAAQAANNSTKKN